MRIAILIGLAVVMTATTAMAQSSRSVRRPYSGTDPYDSKSFEPPKNPYDSSNDESKRPSYAPAPRRAPGTTYYEPYRAPPSRYDAPASNPYGRSGGGVVDQAVAGARRAAGVPQDGGYARSSRPNSVFGSSGRRSSEDCIFSTCR